MPSNNEDDPVGRVWGSSSSRSKRKKVNRNRAGRHNQLVKDYFTEESAYTPEHIRGPRTKLTSLRLRSERGLESWVAVAGQRSQGRAGIEIDRNSGRIQDRGRWNGGRLTQGLRVEAELKEEGLLNTDYRKARTIEGGNFKIRVSGRVFW
ncbi:hypothetical protein CRG98_020603 [Punica granatum]|uniref:Uncharacterized protein n=1 Tax=Punica granatum TaxID=22663 RepID=A0A2I0JRV6_PUNGR|nr:hypothetical protein CRG98_020603 [Punica granatum]